LPTVIDSLIVELGLDPAKYTAGRKQVEQDFGKTKDTALRTAKDIEASGSRAASFFSKLRTEFLALTAAMLSAEALKKLTIDTSDAVAATGRLANTLGIAVKTFSQWQNASRLAGGSAEGMASTISKLTDELQIYQATGIAPPMLAWLKALGIDILEANGHLKSATDLMDSMNLAVQRFDMPKRRAVLESLGIDQGSINLLIQNRDAFRGFLAEADKLGTISKQDSDSAIEFQHSLTGLLLTMENMERKAVTFLTTLRNSEFFASGKMPWWAPSELLKGYEPLINMLAAIKDAFKPGTMPPWAPSEIWKRITGKTPGPQGELSPEQRESTIRSEFAKQGIDPNVAVQVARSEGGINRFMTGDYGSSFGAFQLHKGGIASGGNAGPGLGDEFQRKTGLDPADPANEAAAIRFAAESPASLSALQARLMRPCRMSTIRGAARRPLTWISTGRLRSTALTRIALQVWLPA
jgi:hypothetical protein